MKVELPDGTKIDGTPEEVRELLAKDGKTDPCKYYVSKSKGTILIAAMHSNHLRNTVLKLYREWLNGLHSALTNKELVKALESGPPSITIAAMMQELWKRRYGH